MLSYDSYTMLNISYFFTAMQIAYRLILTLKVEEEKYMLSWAMTARQTSYVLTYVLTKALDVSLEGVSHWNVLK